MSESDNILVVIDPTASKQPALDQAAILAKKLDKQLELFISTHDESLKHYQNVLGEEAITSVAKTSLDKLLAQLETMAEPLRNKGLDISCDVTWDRPIDEGIIRKALESKPFLIIKDTHYHPKLTRSVLRNTDWSLIRTCPFPILFVKHNETWRTPTVLSAVNPINETETELDIDIVRFGELLEDKMQAKHEVLHVCEPISDSYVGMSLMGYAGSLEEGYEELLEMHKNRVNSLLDGQKIDREKIIFVEGDVKKLLPDLVQEKNIDLVIMGSISKSRIVQAFIGGTTEAVLDELDCDILALKPSSFKTPVSAQAPPEYPQVIWPRI